MNRAMTLFYTEVFESLSDKDARGALPDVALKTFVKSVSYDKAHESFRFLKNIHAAALVNAEALRKLVKKVCFEFATINTYFGVCSVINFILTPRRTVRQNAEIALVDS